MLCEIVNIYINIYENWSILYTIVLVPLRLASSVIMIAD